MLWYSGLSFKVCLSHVNSACGSHPEPGLMKYSVITKYICKGGKKHQNITIQSDWHQLLSSCKSFANAKWYLPQSLTYKWLPVLFTTVLILCHGFVRHDTLWGWYIVQSCAQCSPERRILSMLMSQSGICCCTLAHDSLSWVLALFCAYHMRLSPQASGVVSC